MHKLFLSSIVFLSCFCLGMGCRTATPASIKGIVTDSKTRQPLSNVAVRLTLASGELKASTTTNINGNYELKNLSFSKNGDRCTLALSKNGYSTPTLTQTFKNSQNYTLNFSLTPNQAPIVNSLTPADGSTFLAGVKIELKINASDPDQDPLEYQFSIGGHVKQPWSKSNTYNWQTSASDTGAVNITGEARDNKGTTASKTISYHIINPTIEEILKKVADNYAKIYDFKADMALSSTLDDKPFGETEYCRYYFKTPNKEKTETYQNSSRTTKTDIIIINGSTMHLIDPVKNIKQEVNLLADVGIDATQFSQMDIYYNQALFLNNHKLTRNNLDSDLNNMLIALVAIPKTPNSTYNNLGILIDYQKGIIMKFSIYKNNDAGQLELVQETRAIESQQKTPNNAWLPVKMTKTPNLTSGNLVSTLIYNNLQINTGLRDIDFDPTKQ